MHRRIFPPSKNGCFNNVHLLLELDCEPVVIGGLK